MLQAADADGGRCSGAAATRAEDQFKLTADSLRAAITPRTKLLILPYPNNPTGAIMTRDELQAIATVIKGTNIVVLSDEIYNSLTYGPDRHVCFAELDGMKERTIVVESLSKTYAMTGWRIGYLLAPEAVIEQTGKIAELMHSSVNSLAQYAGVAALAVGMTVDEYVKRCKGIKCGFKNTSCPDQLALALEEALAEQKKA